MEPHVTYPSAPKQRMIEDPSVQKLIVNNTNKIAVIRSGDNAIIELTGSRNSNPKVAQADIRLPLDVKVDDQTLIITDKKAFNITIPIGSYMGDILVGAYLAHYTNVQLAGVRSVMVSEPMDVIKIRYRKLYNRIQTLFINSETGNKLAKASMEVNAMGAKDA